MSQVLPVLPDADCWPNVYVQCGFDFDPALEAAGDSAPKFARGRVKRALVRGHATAEAAGEAKRSYVAYLLPKDGEGGEGGEGGGSSSGDPASQLGAAQELEWVREYEYKAKPKAEGEAYFFVVEPEGGEVLYNEITSEISLARKTFRTVAQRPSEVMLTRRLLDEDEEGYEERATRRQKISSESTLLLTHRG